MKKVFFVWGVLLVILGLSSCASKSDINQEMKDQKQMVNRSVQSEPEVIEEQSPKKRDKKHCPNNGQFKNSSGECEEYHQFDKPYRKGGR